MENEKISDQKRAKDFDDWLFEYIESHFQEFIIFNLLDMRS